MNHGTRKPEPTIPCLLFLVALLVPTVWAEILYVDRFDDSSTADVCGLWTANDCALRAAIIRANNNGEADEIRIVMEGTYLLTLDGYGDSSGDLDITDDLVINGWSRDTVIIDASGISGGNRVFDIHSGAEVTMRNLWVTGGDTTLAWGIGAGIFNSGDLTLERIYVSGNTASTHGGGVFNDTNAWLGLYLSKIFDNHADGAGGGVLNLSTMIVTESGIDGNTACGDGAGIYNGEDGEIVLTRSNVVFNVVYDPGSGGTGALVGGGLYNKGEVRATNCTFYGNEAEDNVGGAIFNNGDLHLSSVTLADNVSPMGSAIYNNVHGVVDVDNTLVAGTCATDATWFRSHGGNLESPGVSCDFDHATDQTGVTDPGLGFPGLNGGSTWSLPLLANSPAVDMGCIECVETDQRGAARPIDGDGDGSDDCDSGAYEYDPAEIFRDGFESGDLAEGSAWS